MTTPGYWIVRGALSLAGLGLQLAAAYAIVVTFGVLITLALYGGCVLGALVQYVVLRRGTRCWAGE